MSGRRALLPVIGGDAATSSFSDDPRVAYEEGPSSSDSAEGVQLGKLPGQQRYKLMVAINKFDLLPAEATTTRVAVSCAMGWCSASPDG